ncbi:glycerophosphodiester phosphodiesterase family protein [Rhodanobacter sp. Si-c]|uniref:glycerophosphodiester phosphodiesterase n=1 Tax=Rhodanobacter lycopersici TaxID=3162487 RepID=A0ABV3QDA6_9GAMM
MNGKPLAARVRVIAHRGASAHLPEHTLAAYARAIADGADFIEPDLVMTRDGVLLSRHENEISGTTDVAAHPEFAARRTAKRVDGVAVEGWFTEDFTLAELKTLRARERLPELRGTAHDGRYPLATFAEIVALAAACGRVVGIIPEIKHGTYFREIGLPMEDALLDALAAHAYTCRAPVEIQSFEIGNLRHLDSGRKRRGMANVRLLQLLGEPEEQPYDVAAAGGALDYAAMMRPPGLRDIAAYADAIGPATRAVLPLTPDGHLGTATPLVSEAHAAGLEVHVYTLRPENAFLPPALREGGDPARRHEAGSLAEMRALLDAGIDAFFTDDPALGRRAVDERGVGEK